MRATVVSGPEVILLQVYSAAVDGVLCPSPCVEVAAGTPHSGVQVDVVTVRGGCDGEEPAVCGGVRSRQSRSLVPLHANHDFRVRNSVHAVAQRLPHVVLDAVFAISAEERVDVVVTVQPEVVSLLGPLQDRSLPNGLSS